MRAKQKGKESKIQLLWIGSEHNEKPVPACVEDHLSTRLAKQAPCWRQGYSTKLKDSERERVTQFMCVLDKIK